MTDVGRSQRLESLSRALKHMEFRAGVIAKSGVIRILAPTVPAENHFRYSRSEQVMIKNILRRFTTLSFLTAVSGVAPDVLGRISEVFIVRACVSLHSYDQF